MSWARSFLAVAELYHFKDKSQVNYLVERDQKRYCGQITEDPLKYDVQEFYHISIMYAANTLSKYHSDLRSTSGSRPRAG